MKINRLDHLVLTVKDIATTVDFYERVLGMEASPLVRGVLHLCMEGRRSICISLAMNLNLRQVK